MIGEIEDLFTSSKKEASSKDKPIGIQEQDILKVLETLQTHIKHNGVTLECLKRIGNLVRIPLKSQIFVENNGLSWLLLALRTHAQDPRSVLLICCLFGTLYSSCISYFPSFFQNNNNNNNNNNIPLLLWDSFGSSVLSIFPAHKSNIGFCAFFSFSLGSMLSLFS